MSLRVLILSMFSDPATDFESIKAGADGYLSKAASHESFIRAIHDAKDRSVLDPSATEGISRRMGGNDAGALTDREQEILQHRGLSTKEIAAKLNLPEETVRTNLKSLRQKLGLRYWTAANLKSILKEFSHRIRKGK